MSREILFRGKRLDTGGWVYGYYCKHIGRQVCPAGDELKPEDIAHLIINDAFADWNMPRSLQAYDVDPETVGQYTRIKIGGQKLFEHDIIRYRETGSDAQIAASLRCRPRNSRAIHRTKGQERCGDL